MRMCMCVYAYRSVCVCVCMHTDPYVYVCVCIPIGMCMCVYAYRSVCACVCMHTDPYVYVSVCIPIGMCMCVYAYRSVCVYLCVHTDELASHVHTKSHARFIRPVQTILMRTGKPESASSGRTTSELGHVIGHTAVSKETQCRCKGDILGSKRDLLHTGIPGPCYRAYSSQSLSSSQRSRVQYPPLG